MKDKNELINFMKQNKDSILNGPENLKWQGFNKEQMAEITKIPGRYKRYLYIKTSIAASIVFLLMFSSMSGYYFYYLQPQQQFAAKSTQWDNQDYDIYEEFEDYDSEYTSEYSSEQEDEDSEVDAVVTIDQELVDIDSQLQWMAQPLWQTTS